VQRFVRLAGRIDATKLRGVLTLALLVLGTRSAGAAGAAGCGAPQSPWISVEFAGRGWERRARTEVMADLRAGLRQEAIDVCTRATGPDRAPLAAITLRLSERADLAVTIELHDAVTKKRVGREVSLQAIPQDGRPLATAIAADELLRASWAEVALDRQQKPRAAPPPPEVTAAVRRVLPEPAPRSEARVSHFGLGTRAAIERYDQHTEVGLDLVFRPRLARRWGGELALGLRDGLAERAQYGRVDATASAIGLGVWTALVQASAFELTLELGARASRIVFSGEPDASASGRDASGWAVYGRVGLSPSVAVVAPLRLGAVLGVGAPLKTFSASENSQLVTGARGLELFASLGIVVEL
jgi:hypothetical protein